jgi:hypothetical protein
MVVCAISPQEELWVRFHFLSLPESVDGTVVKRVNVRIA